MNNNSLRDYIQKLNVQEQALKELKKQQAINKIKQLRQQLKEKASARNVIHQ